MNINLIKKILCAAGLITVLMVLGLAFSKISSSLTSIQTENNCISKNVEEGMSRVDVEKSGVCK